MKNSTKYLIVGLIAIVLILLAVVVYRMFFMFKRSKVKAYATEQANLTGNPDVVYQMLIEGCENILKSQDLTKQVKLSAQVEGIEIEKALVLTALNNCYSSGFIAKLIAIEETPVA